MDIHQLPHPDFEKKIIARENLLAVLAQIPRPLVFTNGVFDILHRGHVSYLAQAKSFGKSMIIGVNADASVKMLGKGDDRPLNRQDDRMALLAALQSVDFVTLFEEKTPVELIKLIRPDIYIKGGDYEIETLEETKCVESWGGKAYAIPFIHDRSTTQLVKKIRQS